MEPWALSLDVFVRYLTLHGRVNTRHLIQFSSWYHTLILTNLNYLLTNQKMFASRVNAALADGKQHDAQEFQIYLLDALHEDTNRVINFIYIGEKYILLFLFTG